MSDGPECDKGWRKELVTSLHAWLIANEAAWLPCKQCEGTGVVRTRCPNCRGSGVDPAERDHP